MARSNASSWELTAVGCPDCDGVLQTSLDGGKGHRRYRCFVGHHYSSQSLLKSKELQLACVLGSGIAVLQHIQAVSGSLADGYKHENGARRTLQQRIRQAREQERKIRKVVET